MMAQYRSLGVSENDNSFQPSERSSLLSKMDSSTSLRKQIGLIKQETKEEDFISIDQQVSVYEADSRLANWKKWLDIHREQQDNLSNILNRPPHCLLMNMNFHNLHVNQQKRLLTEAEEYQFCDRERGHPSFWAPVGGAHSTTKKVGTYQSIQKRYDRSRLSEMNWYPRPTELEHVGVPDVIMGEKGLGLVDEPCLPLPKDNWEKSHYVAMKKEHLKQKLELFQEHTPQTETIAVVGSKVTRPTEESTVVNSELEKALESSCDNDVNESPLGSENLTLSIRETISVLVDDEIIDSLTKHFIVYFDECLTYELYEKSLTIQNSNNCCLRFFWEPVLPAYVKSPLPLKQIRNSRTFYFDKNDGVVMPSSKVKFNFYFESFKSGVFCEKWILYLSNAPDKEECVTVELEAVVEERRETEENLKAIDTYIESCTRYAIASKTVKEMLERAKPERPKTLPYDWMFFEEQIFLFNNPDLFYESKSVTCLKEIYKRICEGPWDFSVLNLRKKLLEKTLEEDITETVNEFTATVCHLAKPNLNNSIKIEKHKSVYELLCCFIDRMETESDDLKCILKIPLNVISSLDIGEEKLSRKKSRTSSWKLSSRESVTSKKSSRKKSKRKITFLDEKSPPVSENMSLLRHTLSCGESYGTIKDNMDEKIKRQEYLEALYLKTYHHLCTTVDNISAVIDSFDGQKEKGVLLSLKTKML